jgi:hypothetical protein
MKETTNPAIQGIAQTISVNERSRRAGSLQRLGNRQYPQRSAS